MPRKEKTGVVVSNKNDKTVVVQVPEYRPHPKYKKIIEQNKNYVAADFSNECGEGDRVRIQENRPISKTNPCRHNAAPKHFILEDALRQTKANYIGTTEPTYA